MAGIELAAGIVEHQYFLTEKTLVLRSGPDHAARSRQQLLPEARHRRLRHRRLGGWLEGLSSRASALRLRARTAPAQHGAARALRASGGEPTADPERDRHPDGDQRADPGLGRWRADHGSGAGLLDNFFVACGFTAGIAASGGAGLAMSNLILHGDAGHGSLALRRAPLLGAAGAAALSGRTGHRGLWRLLQDPLAGRGGAGRTRTAALAAA